MILLSIALSTNQGRVFLHVNTRSSSVDKLLLVVHVTDTRNRLLVTLLATLKFFGKLKETDELKMVTLPTELIGGLERSQEGVHKQKATTNRVIKTKNKKQKTLN